MLKVTVLFKNGRDISFRCKELQLDLGLTGKVEKYTITDMVGDRRIHYLNPSNIDAVFSEVIED